MTADRLKEHVKKFMLFGGWVFPLAILLGATESDMYKEWKDPHGYWSQKVNSSETWVRDTLEAVVECTRQLGELQAENGQRIWTAAKKLEGKSDAEAADDYMIGVKSQKYACDGMKTILEVSERKLEEERAKLKKQLAEEKTDVEGKR